MFSVFKKRKKLSIRRNNNIQKANNNINNFRNVLKEGDEGEDVENLQKMLMDIIHIYPKLPVVSFDGKYNLDTKKAVEEFQNMMGINRTGIADSNTLNKLKLIYDKKDEIKAVEKIYFNIDKKEKKNL